MKDKHCPVLLTEVLQGVAVRPEGKYIDATFGRGGHTKALLAQLSPAGRLMIIDKDPRAIATAHALNDERVLIKHGSFAELAEFVDELGWRGEVAGVMMDLGVSSPQLDEAERGFSFLRDGPLDMRMDDSQGVTAAHWIATATQEEIANVIWQYGEERQSRRIARAIVNDRQTSPLETTKQLADVIEKVCPRRHDQKKHPATKSFQAIRIYINRELEDLQSALTQAVDVLQPGGRLAVISFHSLEDRMVKRFMQQKSKGAALPSNLPIKARDEKFELKCIGKVIKASEEELANNVRSRSARLRIAEKVS